MSWALSPLRSAASRQQQKRYTSDLPCRKHGANPVRYVKTDRCVGCYGTPKDRYEAAARFIQ